MLSWTNPDYTNDPHAHVGSGMHRKCELALLSIVATGMRGMVVIGCGRGEEFSLPMLAAAACNQPLRCLGIDRHDLPVVPGVGYWKRDLFPDGQTFCPKVREELRQWRDSVLGNVLWYTDNGFKIGELVAMHGLCKEGDIIGTHDFSTEVPLDAVSFLTEAGFQYLGEFDPYINRFYCLQGFWKKA